MRYSYVGGLQMALMKTMAHVFRLFNLDSVFQHATWHVLHCSPICVVTHTRTRPRFFIPQLLPPNKKLVPEVVRAWELIATHVQLGPQPALSFLLFHMLYHFFILLPSFRPQTLNQVIWDCCHPGITRQQSGAIPSCDMTCKDGKGYAIKPQFSLCPSQAPNKQ